MYRRIFSRRWRPTRTDSYRWTRLEFCSRRYRLGSTRRTDAGLPPAPLADVCVRARKVQRRAYLADGAALCLSHEGMRDAEAPRYLALTEHTLGPHGRALARIRSSHAALSNQHAVHWQRWQSGRLECFGVHWHACQ